MSTTYPLVFTYRVTVQGPRYLAGVQLRGGAVVTMEPDSAYLAHGLQPGGVAGQGVTLREAYHELEQSIELVLYDLAEAAPDLGSLRGVGAGVLRRNRSVGRTSIRSGAPGRGRRQD